ncbi:MAG: hypothetical protein ABL970_00975 [Nitrospira sp.]
MAIKGRSAGRRLKAVEAELVPVMGNRWFSFELIGFTTQAAYDQAFEQAWQQVPDGAAVFCFPKLNDEEWLQESARYMEGLPPLLDHRCGIYLKYEPAGAE